MTKLLFVEKYYEFAKQTELKTGLNAIAVLAQSALESGWGRSAPGNMFFGVKDSDGKNGNEQLLQTTEYSRRMDLKFPVIISITPVVKNGVKMYKYIVKDWFRKFSTPEESFTHHAEFFKKNLKRYGTAWAVRGDYEKFFVAIAKAGYATDPDYAKKLTSMAKEIEQLIKGIK